jgi:nicotinate-nucleotide adenylyltransferase
MVALEKEVPGISGRVTVLDGPNIDISSSDIRERVSKGQPVSELLPGPVDIYIKEHGLYLKA